METNGTTVNRPDPCMWVPGTEILPQQACETEEEREKRLWREEMSAAGIVEDGGGAAESGEDGVAQAVAELDDGHHQARVEEGDEAELRNETGQPEGRTGREEDRQRTGHPQYPPLAAHPEEGA